MTKVYVYAGKNIDGLFGFSLIDIMEINFPNKSRQQSFLEIQARSDLGDTIKVGEVFVVANRKHGLMGIVNVATKNRLGSAEANPYLNDKIKIKGDYMEELKNYINTKTNYDKIVVAESNSCREVKHNVELIVGKGNIKSLVYV